MGKKNQINISQKKCKWLKKWKKNAQHQKSSGKFKSKWGTISFQLDDYYQKKKITNADEDMEGRKPLYSITGNIN